MNSSFEQQLKRVLKHFDDRKQIGEESPLASPYFLSQALRGVQNPNSAKVRGEVLCNEIEQAAATLWGESQPQNRQEVKDALCLVRQSPGTPRYAWLVLELRCFQRYIQLRRPAEIWENEAYLPGSQAEHYRDFDLAISQLGKALLDRLHPTLRPEFPAIPAYFIGYQAQLDQALAALRLGKSINLSGAGGLGKTSLGAMIFQQIQPQPAFWFTFRPTLNDRIGSLLFALGHFLHEQGATNLWQLVVAAGGFVEDYNLALSMLRQDMQVLQANPPVLCFDEVDHLYATDSEQMLSGHTQILALLEGLRGLTPMVLISQKAPIEADLYLTPAGLSPFQIDELFRQAGIRLSQEEAKQYHHYTRGNPRLLMLCVALQQNGESIIEQDTLLERTPGLAALLHRLWQRLHPGERQLLQRLAVFRSAAPGDSWPEAQSYLPGILTQRLATRDELGGVEVLPALRGRIYEELSPDLREQLHLDAAEIRLAHGQYTAAAYHYWKGNRSAKAIQAWYPHSNDEIQRGQGAAAFTIFANISRHGLSKNECKALALIQAELHKLQGELARGRATLEAQDWSLDSEVRVRASILQGEFLDALGYPDQAQRTYGEGVAVTGRLLGQLVTLRRQRSMLHLRQKELQSAWNEARLAECQVHNLRGELEYEGGRFADALSSFQNALVLAQGLGDAASIAQAERNLANLYGRQQNLAQAEEHAQRAVEHYQRTGDRFGMAKMYNNLASIYLDTRQFPAAIKYAAQALEASKAAPYYAAIAATNLAEAYLETGDLDSAQKYAYEVLTQEERQPYPYALFTLGRIRREKEALADAQKHFIESIRIGRENEDHFIVAYAQRELGLLYREIDNGFCAQESLLAALQFFEGAGMVNEAEKTREMMG